MANRWQSGFLRDDTTGALVTSGGAGGSGAGSVQEDEPTQGADAFAWFPIDSQGRWTREIVVYDPGPSPPTPTVPAFTVDPVVTGSGQEGSVLTCSAGTATGYPTPTRTYAWRKDGVANSSTGNTYTPVSGDVGHAVDCNVTITNASGSDTADSNNITVTAAPADLPGIFGAKLVEGWEARAIAGPPADGAAVASWAGVLGVLALANGTSGERPVYKTAIFGSEPVVRFDGTDDTLGGFLPASAINQPWEVLIVCKFRSTTGGKVFWSVNNGSRATLEVTVGSSPQSVTLKAGGNGFFDNATLVTSYHDAFRMWRTHAEGASSLLQIGASVSSPDNGGTNSIASTDNFRLGNADGFGTKAADIDVIACVILNATPTSQQITDFRSRYSV